MITACCYIFPRKFFFLIDDGFLIDPSKNPVLFFALELYSLNDSKYHNYLQLAVLLTYNLCMIRVIKEKGSDGSTMGLPSVVFYKDDESPINVS